MRLVITGALGHIGSRLIRSLPRTFPQAELTLVDNLSTQRYPSLFDLPAEGSYRFVEADILSADLPTMFSGADAVVHLAAITNAEQSFTIREDVERVNVEGTQRVARACLLVGATLTFVSTTSVFGQQSGVVDETCPVEALRPQSPYAESKLRAEEALVSLASEGLRHVSLRFGTIAGASPGMRFHTAVNKFCWQAVMGEPLTVWRAAIDQRRPYLDLEDGVRAIEFVLSTRPEHHLYNVVTENLTVREIVRTIQEIVSDVRISEVDSPQMNQLSYEVSSARLRAAGFMFRGDLRRAISDTISLLRPACME